MHVARDSKRVEQSTRAASSVCSLHALGLDPPPCGEGIGGLRQPSLALRTPTRSVGYGEAPGWGSLLLRETCPLTETPTPNPSPQGGGEHTECVTVMVGDEAECGYTVPLAFPAASAIGIVTRDG